MSTQNDSHGREVFSVHPQIRQDAAGYRPVGKSARTRSILRDVTSGGYDVAVRDTAEQEPRDGPARQEQ